MKNHSITTTILFIVFLLANNTFAQQKGSLTIKIIGITPHEKFVFKDIKNKPLTFTRSATQYLGVFDYGTPYKFVQVSGLRQAKLKNSEGNINSSEAMVEIDCTPAEKKLELVSRSSDSKAFGTFYGSVSASVGGIKGPGINQGQYVAYMTSWNVDPKHGGKNRQIIWFNRGNGRTTLVSKGLDGLGGNNDSYEAVVDVSGYNVAFESHANNLVKGDINNVSDIFIWNLVSDTVRCLTCDGNYASSSPSVSKNGDFVAFQSKANNLTAGVDGKNVTNVYLKNVRTGETLLISKEPLTGKGLGGAHPSISEDGSRIAFVSNSDKLVAGDNNRLWDIFIWEKDKPVLKRISFTASGAERNQGNESSGRIVKPNISGNGKFVTFATTASNMFEKETSSTLQQVYVAEIETGKIIRASETSAGIAGNKDSPIAQGDKIAISYDGKLVAFPTAATNLGGNIILKNIETGKIQAYGTPGNGGVGTVAISRNGNTIVFPSSEKLDKKYNSTGIFAISN
ncbi:PD40 domain-containing protein [Pedobacter zeae]|uniref:Tol biopolymer transport system component n=1 Tax=Pedobacter zeae TaxID=1737356 RepID=A0A7W6KBR2_9SPHI|nr:PD40 domain-containing protein [Pedobacter zeae]MBB4107672.1 Tol biopolymer transport system component [Pedobacter zeae]GGG97826.1 hypothetical protein GCM10007422_09790 [Pedobacter zeae]